MKMWTVAVAAAVIAAAPGAGRAQDVSAKPTFGQARLSAGFDPDPHTKPITAGGSIDASMLGGDCEGYIADAPDFRLNYTAGDFELTIMAVSGSDTTLVINTPDGQWVCDDDSGGDSDPAFRFGDPESGAYDIWVGVYGEADTAEATLTISER
jgi:hypothetical protein